MWWGAWGAVCRLAWTPGGKVGAIYAKRVLLYCSAASLLPRGAVTCPQPLIPQDLVWGKQRPRRRQLEALRRLWEARVMDGD